MSSSVSRIGVIEATFSDRSGAVMCISAAMLLFALLLASVLDLDWRHCHIDRRQVTWEILFIWRSYLFGHCFETHQWSKPWLVPCPREHLGFVHFYEFDQILLIRKAPWDRHSNLKQFFSPECWFQVNGRQAPSLPSYCWSLWTCASQMEQRKAKAAAQFSSSIYSPYVF